MTNWKQVGGENRPSVLLSRESNSGTHVFFLEHVIRLGDAKSKALFSPETLLLLSSEGITTQVRQNPNAIGYDGLRYVTPPSRSCCPAASPSMRARIPSRATCTCTPPASRPARFKRILTGFSAGRASAL
jgi:phosphate transport system substrate-binding protein